MPKKSDCYFKCKYEGQLFRFPPLSCTSYEKYFKWKNILRKEDKKKDDYFIVQNFKLCSNHFEKYYFTEKNRLIRHAVPTLKLGITLDQEELLCTFIEENPDVIIENLSGLELETVIIEWKTIEPKLNALGPGKSSTAWQEYLDEVMSNLKTKKAIWRKESGPLGADIQRVKNTDDFTDLEIKILEMWRNEIVEEASLDISESDFPEENEIYMECIIEDGDSDNSGDSDTGRISKISECSVNSTSTGNKNTNEIVTYTLNVATEGHEPLLQAAGIAPCEAPKENSNVKCKCVHSPSEVQDEFDAFGKDIAQQLRSMPRQTALETRKLLISVLRSKRRKILNDSFLKC